MAKWTPVKPPPPQVLAALEQARKDHKVKWEPNDGCSGSLHVAYQFAETIFIYPITPTTPIGEGADQLAASGKPNAFGIVPKVQQMQSEAGAAGGVHGTVAIGALSTTFTASQGLLLMIPVLYKLAGELQPCVLHIAARAVAGQALAIFGDHSDIMAVRSTGMALLSAHSVQESMDMALVSHIATLLSSIPFIHFFDGMRTSHEIQKCEVISEEQIKRVVELLQDKIDAFRSKALNFNHPTVRGTAQCGDVFFQNVEAANPYMDAVAEHVRTAMRWVEALTGRKYDIFDYVGHPQATDVIVIMGCGAAVVEELIDHYGPSKKVGVVKVHLYRPWSAKHLLATIPSSVKRIAVLDRCKETGLGEPLYTDICATMQTVPAGSKLKIIGGRYGLASKDFTTGMVHSIFENLRSNNSKHPFTIGFDDDVTFLSLPYEPLNTVPEGTAQSVIYGFGSDGTVGANKNAIKLIAKETNLYAQGYFAYDALKAGGITCSHLRFGPKPIKSSYEVTAGAKYVGIHKKEYVRSLSAESMLSCLEPGGILVLNSPWTTAQSLRENLPLGFRQMVVKQGFTFYNIDASSVARRAGMGRMINNIMQTVFFHLAQVMDAEKAIAIFKQAVSKTYKSKGPEVVHKNIEAIDMSLSELKKIDIPNGWEVALPGEVYHKVPSKVRGPEVPAEVVDVLDKMHTREGDSIPVSKFQPGGQVMLGMTQWAKRGVAACVPVVDLDKCTQCNKCAAICPHAVIRPFLASPAELKSAPAGFETRKATGGHAMAGLSFRIQASPLDCTGCEVCVTTCPDNALKMTNMEDVMAQGHDDNWNFAMKLPDRSERFDKFSIKGSQFNQPLLEFSGACEGCGETPYAKLITQLFGQRLIVANTTGCSSIWGGTAGWVPYTVHKETGKGPAWGNSLFEDNAEYGLGMVLGMQQRRKHLTAAVENALAAKEYNSNVALAGALQQWLERKEDGEMSQKFGDDIQKLLDMEVKKRQLPSNLSLVSRLRDVLTKPAMWMFGGDGWANDIGFGGLDHAVALGENINIMVMDTEVYSNTGGQSSKATPLGSVAKFAQKGRRQQKKDLGGCFMHYANVYVASVAIGANFQQCVRAFQEAEAHPGPAVVICYSPCIEHRTKTGMSQMGNDQRAAVECGYWPLYRFDPKLEAQGEAAFQLDAKTITGKVTEFLRTQNRYAQLERSLPEDAEQLQKALNEHLAQRHAAMKERSEKKPLVRGTSELIGGLKGPELYVLYGSETGTAEVVARKFVRAAKDRNCTVKKCTELNDVCDLETMDPAMLIIFCATCGDGDIPGNAKGFWEYLEKLNPGQLGKHRFAMFALGDKGYAKFCEAGKLIDGGLQKVGGQQVLPMGIGDQCDEDGWETGYSEWLPRLMDAIKAPAPAKRDGPPAPLFQVEEHDDESAAKFSPPKLCPPEAVLAKVEENRRMPPPEYERDVRHFVLSNKDVDMPFHLGDAIAIFPENLPADVNQALTWFGYNPDTAMSMRLLCEASDVHPRLAAVCKQRTTARQLLTEVVDLFGRPSKGFYLQLADFATDAKEKAKILEIANGDGYKAKLEESVSYFDIFKQFPSAKPSLAHLVALVPAIKYRLYSIANSADYKPGCVELTIVVNQWKTKSGNVKTGTSTKYIADLPVGARVACTMTCGTFTFPEDHVPMVMSGLGTGIAPMRSFVQDRAYKKKVLGKDVGPMVLFYGCRHEREEFFYKEEWKQHQADGVLTHLVNAFSHDKPHYPPKMIFVNQKMEENLEMIGKYMGTMGGYFYMCGLAVAAPGIEAALKKAMIGAKVVTAEGADDWVENLKRTGRYSMESY